ncbi:DUF2203 domain-containing protein [Candidatus Woesearchaeota archaeon]|nr:DUF2203 domain-containing protein [Candidatus Woesearchaeota archaeon]
MTHKRVSQLPKGIQIRKRYVTLPEARANLLQVQRTIERLMKLNTTLFLLSEVEIEFEDEFRENLYDIALSKKFYKLSHQFFTHLERLHNMSCIVKDIEVGLVDFYSLHDDREIFLCYQYGDKDIRHWHEIDEGCIERQSTSFLDDHHDCRC